MFYLSLRLVFLNTPGTNDLLTLNEDAEAVGVAGQSGGVAHFGFRLANPGDLESAEGLEREQIIRQRSIENYTPMRKDEVMAWLNNRYMPRIYTTPDTSGDGQQSVDWSG